jgi:hypothetical protein
MIYHFFTGPCASSASICTHFTMLHAHFGMFFTFVGTGVTDIRANGAKIIGKFAVQHQQLCRCITQSSTLQIEVNTFCLHVYIFFFQTGARTEVTSGGTGVTQVNAILKSRAGHNFVK